MIEIISGDLLLSDAKFIAHQTNCISKGAAGIAAKIFQKYPYANSYITRANYSSPGTIEIFGNNQNQRYIINMYAQFNPGKPDNSKIDNQEIRKRYFYNCLKEIAKIKDLESIAFNYNIGCGLAGGNWEEYLALLQKFESYVYNKFSTKVTLYKL